MVLRLTVANGDKVQVDPHCAYKISMGVSISTVATRFLVIHGLQVSVEYLAHI